MTDPILSAPNFEDDTPKLNPPIVPCWMTKREYFAALAMQGIVASGEASQISPDDMEWVANYSVATADALIARLEK